MHWPITQQQGKDSSTAAVLTRRTTNKGKKRKHEEKEVEKDKEETGQQIKSIADLFASSSTDPALEALFKQNVLAHVD